MAEQAPHQTFQVTEILEAILLQLPMGELLVTARRVSRVWKTTIDSSGALQQRLFLQPSPAYSSSLEHVFLNPLLQQAFPPWFRTMRDAFTGRKFVAGLPWTTSADRTAAFMRSDASWRKMLPCQPIKRTIEIVGKINGRTGIFETNGRVKFEHGIRMGTLYDYGFETLRRFSSSFWIEWDECKVSIAGDDSSETHMGPEWEEDKVTMFTHYSWFKSGGSTPPQVGEEFRSEAYEELKVDLREEQRSRYWHGGFCNPPNGGWQLR